MPVQIESHRLHLQVRHVQLLRAKFLAVRGEKKTKEKWTNALRSNELQANNGNTRGERKIYVDRGNTSRFSLSLSKIKIRAKTFYGQS